MGNTAAAFISYQAPGDSPTSWRDRETLARRSPFPSPQLQAHDMECGVVDVDFDQLVEDYYQPLYRFALSLSRNESDAVDLTQQTFATWAAKGHQLRDGSKAKTWLFTTLYRAFLGERRRAAHFVEADDETEFVEPPHVSPSAANAIDAQTVQRALHSLEERYRAPVTLFYMQQHAYREIAEILQIPIGTVMSRISRGKAELRKALGELDVFEAGKLVAFDKRGQDG